MATTTIAATIPTSCVFEPSDAGTAVRLALDEIGKPCEKPEHRFVTPSAASSWFGSMRYPSRVPIARPVNTLSL